MQFSIRDDFLLNLHGDFLGVFDVGWDDGFDFFVELVYVVDGALGYVPGVVVVDVLSSAKLAPQHEYLLLVLLDGFRALHGRFDQAVYFVLDGHFLDVEV